MTDTNKNEENSNKTEKTLSKTLRNRIVGLLVLVSIVLIFIPFLMKDEVQAQRSADAIAITPEGAVTDNNGQLVSAGEHDYSDLLDPVDDTKPAAASGSAPASSPFDALKTKKSNSSSQNSSQPAVADSSTYAVPQLEEAVPSASVKLPTVENKGSEVLKSSHSAKAQTHSANTSAKPAPNREDKLVSKKTAGNAAVLSGNYAAQVGVFSKKSGADKIIAQLKKAGFKPVTQKVNINGKPLIKVYAATSKSRDTVQAVCQKVKSATGIKCMIQNL